MEDNVLSNKKSLKELGNELNLLIKKQNDLNFNLIKHKNKNNKNWTDKNEIKISEPMKVNKEVLFIGNNKKREREEPEIKIYYNSNQKKLLSVISIPKNDEKEIEFLPTKKIQSVINKPMNYNETIEINDKKIILSRNKTNFNLEQVIFFYKINSLQDIKINQLIKNKDSLNDPDSKERNKKMVGSLLSHLGKAKQKLDTDFLKIKLQETISIKISEDEKSMIEDLKEQQIILSDKIEKEMKDEQKEIETKIKLVEKEIAIAKMNEYQDKLSNYILTKTKPEIYWKPAIENSETNKLFDESKINNKITKDKYQANIELQY